MSACAGGCDYQALANTRGLALLGALRRLRELEVELAVMRAAHEQLGAALAATLGALRQAEAKEVELLHTELARAVLSAPALPGLREGGA